MPLKVAATINHLPALVTAMMFGCSGTHIYNPEVGDEGSGQPETTTEPHDLVYYLRLASWTNGKSLTPSPSLSPKYCTICINIITLNLIKCE